MKELLKAVKKFKEILAQSEKDGDEFSLVMSKMSSVKVHGVVFPTMMLMEIVEDFTKSYAERRKAEKMSGFDEGELQDKWSEASMNWNNKDTLN
jgi:hypothetical protein